MKKFFEFAVAVIMMTLCSVIFWNCSGSEIYGDEPNPGPTDPTVESVERNNCTANVVNSYTADNAEIKTRAVAVPQGNYEALISAQSVHQFVADVFYTDGSVKQDSASYTVTNTVKGYGLKKTRYARSIKVFEKWSEQSTTLEDGRVVRAYTFNGEQGGEVFKLSTIDEQTCSDESVTIKGQEFKELCKNHWTSRKLVEVKPVYLEQDSAEFMKYRIDFIFNDALAYGTDAKGVDNRKVEFTMHGEKVWVAKEGEDPEIPDTPDEVIAYNERDKGFEFVKDSISTETKQKITVSKAWIQFEKLLSTGEVKLAYRPEVLLYCRVDTPAYQVPVKVADFNIEDLQAEKYSNLPYGEAESRGYNISVRKYSQKFVTRTNKAQFTFDGQSEQATVVDSLGIEHQFEKREWSFNDLGSKATDMEDIDGQARKLLTSNISATFNSRSDNYKGQAELWKMKDGQNKTGIDVINERPVIKGDKVIIEFDKETKYNDGSRDTIFNLVFDPNYRVTTENPIPVKNRDYARKSMEAAIKLVKKSTTENGNFKWQACQYSNTFEYVGFNNALQAYVPESVIYTDEDGLSDEVKIPAWTLNWVKFAKSDKNEGDDKNQIYTDTIHYQFNLAQTITPIKPKQLLRASISGDDPQDPSAIRYEYGPKEYKVINTQTIYVYRIKYAIYDDGSRKEIGEVGHNVTFYINTPQDEEKIVSSLNISKLEPSYGNKVKTSETTDGAYTVYSYKKEAVTRSSQSTHVFTGYWDEIIYTDEFGQEIDFTVFEWMFNEVSGTFSDLAEENNYERKLFTSVMNGKFIDSKDYTVKVIFKMQKEEKKLKSVEYGNHGITYRSGNTWNAWQEYTKIYSDGSRENAKANVDLNYIITPEGEKDAKVTEAKAPHTGVTAGAASKSTRSGGQNITVTTTKQTYVEGYTVFNNQHTAVSETAAYSAVEDGVSIKFNFDAVNLSNIAHHSDNSNSLTKSGTKNVGGVTYDVYPHTGSLGYTVDGKNFTSTCKTNLLVEQVLDPNVPSEWGAVKGFGGWTLVYDPNVGNYGAFRECIIINFEKGKWMILDNNWSDTSHFFTWDVCYDSNQIRSAAKLDNGTFFPATLTLDGTGWTYAAEPKNGAAKAVPMSQQQALLAGIKNFTGDSTAEVTPERGGYGTLSGNKLAVYNKSGLLVFTVVSKK